MLFFTSTDKTGNFNAPSAVWRGNKNGEAECISGGYFGVFENGRLVSEETYHGSVRKREAEAEVRIIEGELGELLSKVPPGDYNDMMEAAIKISREYAGRKKTLSYDEAKKHVFAKGSIEDGYNGDYTEVEFSLVNNQIIVVSPHGCYRSGLPEVKDTQAAIGMLLKAPLGEACGHPQVYGLHEISNQEDLIQRVTGYSDQLPEDHPAGRPPNTFHWDEHKEYPVSNFITANDTKEAWIEWFKFEQKIWADEGQPDRFDDMLTAEIAEPVYGVDLGDGEALLWDGNHRVAASVVAGRETIPAIIGKPLDQNLIVVYHGTDKEFDSFNGPAYFTQDLQDAATYGKRVIKAQIDIGNLFDTEVDGQEEECIDCIDPEYLQGKGHEGATGLFLPFHDVAQRYYFIVNPDRIKIINPDVKYKPDPQYQNKDSEESHGMRM